MRRKEILFAELLILVCLPFLAWGAQKTITTYTWDSAINVTAQSTDFTKDASIVENTGNAVTISTDPDNPANPMVSLGNDSEDTCGAIWLGGAGTTNVTCTENKCPFGSGFRSYFEFRIINTDSSNGSTDRGDGFTFTFMNGAQNDRTRRGGPASGSMGELMCYAGSDNTANGRGLDYPKMAIEFDTYPNDGTLSDNGCNGGRNDANNRENHMALMFWGANTNGDCSNNNRRPCISYDDNVHSIPRTGSASAPKNSNFNESSGYYYRQKPSLANNWLEDNTWHLARVEVMRNTTTNTYNVKAWVDCEACSGASSTCTACASTEINNYFKDILNQYYNAASPRTGSVAPKIDRTVTLASSLPSFDKVLFGFTEGTGEKTQTVQIRNFKIYFTPSAAAGCSGYRVWNTYGDRRPFSVGGNCRGNIDLGSEITTATITLQSGETVIRYGRDYTNCNGGIRGTITYDQAVGADTDGDCQINYTSSENAGDR